MRLNIREKPHRLPRDCYRGRVVVSLTACVDERHTPFLDGDVVSQFRGSLARAVEKYSCLVLIYCFMPDHLHVILQGQDDSADSWRAMVDFKQQSGFWFGRNRPQDGWQKDFYDHIIRADEDLGAQIRYIADNPVRRGLVKMWSEYPFTGAIGIDLKQVLADAATL
jgi:REP element-mobilizing transposase RayT